jgi:hypothetical protein
MSKPLIHAISSARRFGGVAENYVAIHDYMDSSKSTVSDNRHRVLTHQGWFIGADGPLERIFGKEILVPRENLANEFYALEGKIQALEHQRDVLRTQQRRFARIVNVRDVGEQHVLEDFQGRFIPTVADYLHETPISSWMNNAHRGLPPSVAGRKRDEIVVTLD